LIRLYLGLCLRVGAAGWSMATTAGGAIGLLPTEIGRGPTAWLAM
jgi:hypothetical protein